MLWWTTGPSRAQRDYFRSCLDRLEAMIYVKGAAFASASAALVLFSANYHFKTLVYSNGYTRPTLDRDTITTERWIVPILYISCILEKRWLKVGWKRWSQRLKKEFQEPFRIWTNLSKSYLRYTDDRVWCLLPSNKKLSCRFHPWSSIKCCIFCYFELSASAGWHLRTNTTIANLQLPNP